MKSSHKYPTAEPAFSLVEMLVAVSVLAMLTVLTAQMFGTISRSCLSGQNRANNFTKARSMLDLVARDVQGGVFREDLAAFPNAFYTKRPGVGGERNLTLVQYAINSGSSDSTLRRGDVAIAWDSVLSFGRTTDFGTLNPTARDLAPGVVGFQMKFLNDDGTLTANYSRDARAMVVTVAVVDDVVMKILHQQDKDQALRTALAGKITGTRSVRAEWEDYLNKDADWSSYPKGLAEGLKIFERYVELPTNR